MRRMIRIRRLQNWRGENGIKLLQSQKSCLKLEIMYSIFLVLETLECLFWESLISVFLLQYLILVVKIFLLGALFN